MDVVLVTIAYDTPGNLLPHVKYGGVLISDYPNPDIIRAYKSHKIKQGFLGRTLNSANLTLPFSFLVNSNGKIMRKFTSHLFGRANSEELLYAIAKYLY